ncbi:ATP-binding protein [Paraglaciecola aquimarina]|uniref:histidine kinase n=1 Tax=Paraglaciecola aquimarina TaxID=1235557 RepID=A0ABU3SSX1_9ALTE|nr:ATP-binding protein [Paraglaciecola aquimarina]MDU0353073.1 ATP-binding protein [Paraglaciecola aquimarina]
MSQDIYQQRYLSEKKVREELELLLEAKTLELETLKNNLNNTIKTKTKEALSSSNLAKTQFLANMSHEIRTPLTAIIGFAQILRHEKPSPSEQDKYLDIITTNGRHLTNLVAEILDLAQIDSQNLTLKNKRFNLVQLLTELQAVHFVAAQSKSLSLDFDVAQGIPEWIVSDPDRLKQVLHNLLSNAIKFTDHGGITFQVCANWQSYTLTFVVTDTGTGISAEQQEHIFDSFKQADSSVTRKNGGTGLGLSIAKSIVKLMGGQLNVESVPNQGSQFTATIKSNKMEGRAHLLPLFPNPMSASEFIQAPALSGEVLLVEDVPVNQQLISHHIKQTGANVVLAENGLQGIEMAMSKEFCVVLMDIQMPVLDGKEALKGLLQLGYSRPIYALTANVMQEDKDEYKQLGFNGVLHKPLELNHLFEVLSQHLPPSNEVAEHPAELALNKTINDIIKPKFLSSLQDHNPQLKLFNEQQEYARIADILHIIKGNAGTFGYDILTETADLALTLIRSNNAQDASIPVQSVITQIDTILQNETIRG